MLSLTHGLLLATTLCTQLLDDAAFPVATPEEVGLTQAGVAGVEAAAHAFVDAGRIAGFELLIVQDRRTVLHAAGGWKDREAGEPMEPGTLFDLRSMTKPLVGAAAQALIDAGALSLETRVASILPEFGRPRDEDITVEMLLAHRSGLGWSVCMDAGSLAAMASCCAELGPTEFLPGTDFLYSNAGSNVLAAALEVVSGQSLEELVRARVLAPLRSDAFVPRDAADPRFARLASVYAPAEDGEKTTLERVWSPADGPRYAFLQGAQGLASSAVDYARFLAMMIDSGAVGDARLLSTEAVQRALKPTSHVDLPTTFPGRRVYYAQHWRVWTRGDEIEIFGHSGSDGTFAWAWPERDLIVVYMTQTVLTTTGIELEEELDRWLLAPDRGPVSAELAPFVGFYWSDDADMIRTAFVNDEGRLALEVPGTAVFGLDPTDDPLRFAVRGRAEFDVRFERDDAGRVTAMIPPAPTGEAKARRIEPAPGLPTVDALMARRLGGPGREGEGALANLGVFRMSGTYTTTTGQEGVDVLLSDGLLRSREESGDPERGLDATVCNGERVQTVSRRGRRRDVTGPQRVAAITGRLAAVVGDWRRFHDRVTVVARVEREGEKLLVVHATVQGGPPITYLVGEEDALPRLAYTSIAMPMGSMGKTTRFEDYRDVEGVRIPFRWVGGLASAAMGGTTVQYEEIETHLQGLKDPFRVEDVR